MTELAEIIFPHYASLKNPTMAIGRDLGGLLGLDAIAPSQIDEDQWKVSINLNWHAQITESQFFERVRKMPKGKTFRFLR